MKIVSCIVCGSEFTRTTSQRSCSDACKREQNRRRMNDWQRQKRATDEQFREKERHAAREWARKCRADPTRSEDLRQRNQAWMRTKREDPKFRERQNTRVRDWKRKQADLVFVLKKEVPELLKEFGL